MNPESDSPLALRFEEAIQPSAFLVQLRTSAENQTRRELASLGSDAFKTALSTAKFVLDRDGMQVIFEGGIPKGAKLMRDLGGKALPTLVNGKSGKIMKVGRVVSSGRKVVSAAAGAALVVVNALIARPSSRMIRRSRVTEAVLRVVAALRCCEYGVWPSGDAHAPQEGPVGNRCRS